MDRLVALKIGYFLNKFPHAVTFLPEVVD
jgi:hypothetical protein